MRECGSIYSHSQAPWLTFPEITSAPNLMDGHTSEGQPGAKGGVPRGPSPTGLLPPTYLPFRLIP